MIIRKVTRKDYQQILNIYNFYILNSTATFEITPITFENFSKRIDGISSIYPFFVYEENEEILGYAYLSSFNEREAYEMSVDLSIYVKSDHKNRGIGRKLYLHIEDIAKKLGYYNIISLVAEENLNSIIFHEKMGFIKCGTIEKVAYKFFKCQGLVYYVKRINDKENYERINKDYGIMDE